MLKGHRVGSGGKRQYLCVSVWLFSDKLLKIPVLLPHISQKEESIEQLEFRYDEFGFRVDKEGKTSPIPPICIVSSPSHGRECGFQVWQD